MMQRRKARGEEAADVVERRGRVEVGTIQWLSLGEKGDEGDVRT